MIWIPILTSILAVWRCIYLEKILRRYEHKVLRALREEADRDKR